MSVTGDLMTRRQVELADVDNKKTTNASRINNDDAWRDVERTENAEEEM